MTLPHLRTSARRRLDPRSMTLAAVGALLSLGGCSASLEDEGPDGPPAFGGTPANTATNAPLAPNNPAAASSSGNTAPGNTAPGVTGSNNEQSAASNAPIANNSQNEVNGAAGSAATDNMSTGVEPGMNAGAAGASGMPPLEPPPGAPEPVVEPPPVPEPPPVIPVPVTPPPPPPPPAPEDPSPEQIADYFDSLPCGARYSALGDGGWRMCLRLADGGGACTTANGSEVFERVTFAGGAPLTNVAQIAGMRDSQVSVVTTGGALHVGGLTSVSTTPLIASGVVNVSGGFHASVALVEQGGGFGIMAWQDNGAPTPRTLPDGAQPIQVSANYGLACALSTAGDVYCWDAGSNHGLAITAAPTPVPLPRAVQMISVGQNSVCGVSFDGTLECQAAWYDNPYLPTQRVDNNTQTSLDDFRILPTTFPSVREVHSGFKQGIVVKGDGTAVYLGDAFPPSDNPGQAFTGATDVISASGDRGNACVQTRAGAVFCRAGTAIRRATLAGAPLIAQTAACPL